MSLRAVASWRERRDPSAKQCFARIVKRELPEVTPYNRCELTAINCLRECGLDPAQRSIRGQQDFQRSELRSKFA